MSVINIGHRSQFVYKKILLHLYANLLVLYFYLRRATCTSSFPGRENDVGRSNVLVFWGLFLLLLNVNQLRQRCIQPQASEIDVKGHLCGCIGYLIQLGRLHDFYSREVKGRFKRTSDLSESIESP